MKPNFENVHRNYTTMPDVEHRKIFTQYFKNSVPNILVFNGSEIDNGEAFNAIIKKYKIPKENYYFSKNNKDLIFGGFALIENGIALSIGNGSLRVLYSDEISDKKVDNVCDIINKCVHKRKSGEVNVLCFNKMSGFYLQKFDVKKFDVDIPLYYDGLTKDNKKILKRLNTEDDKGIVILHGEPGTGKSTYIRYLCRNVNKRLIYIPPDLAREISSPNFIPFLMNNPNSVLIIEDAENILEKRNGRSSQAVSNLLNISDGLLADCLKMQLVCTFNTDINKVDSALLRPGRLISKCEFKKLPKKKVDKLVKKLKMKIEVTDDMSLSEIFNQNDKVLDENVSEPIGFKKNKS